MINPSTPPLARALVVAFSSDKGIGVPINELKNVKMDVLLLKNFIKDCNHVWYDLLLPKKMHGYNLRTRPHQHVLPIKNVFADKNFLDRMLYVDMY